jgi:hypothetical protein
VSTGLDGRLMRQLDGVWRVLEEKGGGIPGASEVSESRLLNEPYGLLSSSSHIAPSCSTCFERVGKVAKDACQLVAAMNVCLGKLRVAPASNLQPNWWSIFGNHLRHRQALSLIGQALDCSALSFLRRPLSYRRHRFVP